jgi:hypothetical protein
MKEEMMEVELGEGIESNTDEIKQFVDCRYVSESYWRIVGCRLNGRYPSIFRLQIHLPNQQTVYFNEEQNIETVLSRSMKTMLTEWFEINKTDSLARNITYSEAPTKFTWNSKEKNGKEDEEIKVVC